MVLGELKRGILLSLKVNPTVNNWGVLTSCYHYVNEWNIPRKDVPLLSSIGKWMQDNLENDSKEAVFTPEELPYRIQDGMSDKQLKNMAAFYTGPEASQAFALAALSMDDIILCDPFCGGGAILSVVAPVIKDKLRAVYGFEIFPFAAMGAYISTLHAIGLENINKLKIFVGDAFSIASQKFFGGGLFGDVLERPNVVFTNPPYLPSAKVDKYAMRAAERVLSMGKYNAADGNFTSWGAALGDVLLQPEGLYGIVLPNSIFYNDKTREALEMFYERYDTKAILTRDLYCKPYSLACKATDVVIIGYKGGKTTKYYASMVDDETMLSIAANLDLMPNIGLVRPKIRSQESPLGEINPGAYLMEPELSDAVDKIFSSVSAKMGNPDDIFGKDCYEPQAGITVNPIDLFFVPNDKWELVGAKGKGAIVENRETKYKALIENTVDVFLRARHGKGDTIVTPSHKALLFNEILTPAERIYIDSWEIKRSGRWWTDYRKMILRKKPSNVLLTRVRNLSMDGYAGTAVYSKEPLPPVSAFVRFSSGDSQLDKITVSWYNSIFFMAMIIAFGRRLNQGCLYMTMGEYKKFPFPKINTMTAEERASFSDAVDGMNDLGSFWESIPRPHDKAWCKWLGLKDEDLDRLVNALRGSRARWKPVAL